MDTRFPERPRMWPPCVLASSVFTRFLSSPSTGGNATKLPCICCWTIGHHIGGNTSREKTVDRSAVVVPITYACVASCLIPEQEAFAAMAVSVGVAMDWKDVRFDLVSRRDKDASSPNPGELVVDACWTGPSCDETQYKQAEQWLRFDSRVRLHAIMHHAWKFNGSICLVW